MPPPGYLDVAGIDACVAYLVRTYPALCQTITLPEPSREGRIIRAVRLRAGSGTRNGVLLIGGTHARELINPDLLVRFAIHLCSAYTNGTGLTYGGKEWSTTDIRLVLEANDIFILPQLNPDGRAHVFAPGGDPWWRKNRSVNPGSACRGTDLNRNYDFLWPWTIGQTSSNPCSDTYAGAAAFSEPETRNVRWLMGTYDRIVGFIDVHSYSELLLYPWGDDDNQTAIPDQNFRNSAWNGLRGVLGSGYAEHITAADQDHFRDVGVRVRSAIAAVRGRTYTIQESSDLYPTSGVSADYAYARYFSVRGTKVWGWVFETNSASPGWQDGFQPPYSDALAVMDEVSSGLIQFLLTNICVVREVGSRVLDEAALDRLRLFRDQFMQRSAKGRTWAGLLDRHSEEMVRLVSNDRRMRAVVERSLKEAASLVTDDPASTTLAESAASPMFELLDLVEEQASAPLKYAARRLRKDLTSTIGRSPVKALGRLKRDERVPGSESRLKRAAPEESNSVTDDD